jgi:RluA family pseudouridine synthase
MTDLSTAPIVNIAAYKFVTLTDVPAWREKLLSLCRELELKGTILLAEEGINLFLAGPRESIDRLTNYLSGTPEFANLEIKESPSSYQPFSRMLVRVKKEIIAFGVEQIDPRQHTSAKVGATELAQWIDEGRDFTLLDVRNDYEIELGTFEKAKPIGIDHFRNFPEAVGQLPENLKQKPVVMFCTGGIRCEKAGPLMQQAGYENVFQLDGGILKYFEVVGSKHYAGECFVFDKRVAVDPSLAETATTQCYACQHPLTADDQKSELYVPPQSCPYCYQSPSERMQENIKLRQIALKDACDPLPGSQPYDNFRPLNVPGRYDRSNLIEFLCDYHPHVSREAWLAKIAGQKVWCDDRPLVDPDQIVRGGQRLEHLLPATTEPAVNSNVVILHEDEAIIVVNKPAPLAMHPCGRFNRNTLIYFLNEAYQTRHLRILHRLDANTSGLVVVGRKAKFARLIQRQFLEGLVKKTYLARVAGQPDQLEFDSNVAIGKRPGRHGIRLPDDDGLPAKTEFTVLQKNSDGTAIVECRPMTGRTNQIRIHLWSSGFPIVGDPVYWPEGKLGRRQTLTLDDPPMCLHAWKLEFIHPISSEGVKFAAVLPAWTGEMERINS